MSPLSAPVLVGAGAVSAPALWRSLVTGSSPVVDGLLHFLVAVLVCWVALNVLTTLVGPPPEPTKADAAETVARRV